jgi:hypothetical protein
MGKTRSFGDHGAWGLLGGPPERAREQCVHRGSLGAVTSSRQASGLCRPAPPPAPAPTATSSSAAAPTIKASQPDKAAPVDKPAPPEVKRKVEVA